MVRFLRSRPPLAKVFDASEHPRSSHGKFSTAAGARAIASASDAVRFGGVPGLGHKIPGIENGGSRSLTRGEGWQRIGNKIDALPVHYTGSKGKEKPVGSFLHLKVDQQIPRDLPVQAHMRRFADFINIAKNKRSEILEAAEKVRVGQKHVYLKPHEPASGGRYHWRMKPDKYPIDTPKATLHRAYNHAALLAMHDQGLVDYDFKMDEHLKNELKPTEPLIRYVRSTLNQHFNVARPGQRREYVEHFGTQRMKRKYGQDTGVISTRLRPNQQLIKMDEGSNVMAAGTMLVSHASGRPRILLLKRSMGSNHGGEWCFPGGHIDPGETARVAAIRETREEAGKINHGPLMPWVHNVANGVDFTTFVSNCRHEDQPTLNEEHTKYIWAPLNKLPRPMHPGCAVAINKLRGDKPLAKRFGIAGKIGAGAVNAVDKQAFSGNTIAHKVGSDLGAGVARGVKFVVKHPVKAVRRYTAEGARFGAGFASGIAGQTRLGRKSTKQITRVGAVLGGTKLAVGGGLLLHKPVMRIARSVFGSSPPDDTKKNDRLTKFEPAKHPRSNTGKFAAAGGVAGAATLGAGAVVASKASDGLQSLAARRGRRSFRNAVSAHKAAGGKIMYRGAPVADPTPQARSYGAVYVTPDKETARFFGKTVNRYTLHTGLKLLSLHEPDMKELLTERLAARLPKDSLDSSNIFGEHRLSSISSRNRTLLRVMGYHGVEVPQFERHDGYAIPDPKNLKFLGSGRAVENKAVGVARKIARALPGKWRAAAGLGLLAGGGLGAVAAQ